MSSELEARLLASVPTIGHFQRLEDMGIGEESFKHYGPMYRYISQVVREHNHLPRLLDLKATFNIPQHVQRKPEEYEWLLDEFLQITTIQRLQSVMDTNVERYGAEPQELLPSLIRDLTKLQVPEQRGISITDQSATARLERYQQLADTTKGMMVGIPTGISYFDAEYGIGWMPGELIGLVGRLYIGKSWMLMYFGMLAWEFGKRVLLLSPEMPENEAEARFDVLVYRHHGINVDITDLYRGIKPSTAQRELAAKLSARANWITMSSAEGHPFRLGEIPRLIRQFSPDVLLIDGLLLVGADSRTQAWEQIKDLSYGLKNMAVGNELVIIVAHQANRNAQNTARPPGLHEIYMGDAFGQACDRLVVLSQPTPKKEIIRLTIQKFRKGKPLHRGTDFSFEPQYGRVKEIVNNQGATGDSGSGGGDLQEWAGTAHPLPIP